MTTCTESIAQGRAPAAWLQRSAGAVKSLWQAYWDRRAQHATVTLMQSLDAQTLRDIGINRSEIESVVYGPHHERRHRWSDSE